MEISFLDMVRVMFYDILVKLLDASRIYRCNLLLGKHFRTSDLASLWNGRVFMEFPCCVMSSVGYHGLRGQFSFHGVFPL